LRRRRTGEGPPQLQPVLAGADHRSDHGQIACERRPLRPLGHRAEGMADPGPRRLGLVDGDGQRLRRQRRLRSRAVSGQLPRRLRRDHLKSKSERAEVTAPGDSPTVKLSPEPTAKLEDTVTEQVTEHLEDCVKAKTLMPAGCVFGYDTDNEIIGDISWSLERRAESSLT